MQNLDKIAEDLFNKIRGRFSNVTIGNADGNVTDTPKTARFFDFEYTDNGRSLGKVSVAISEDNEDQGQQSLTVIYSKDFISNEDQTTQSSWFNFLKELRQFSKKRRLKFDIRDINKTNLDKRDYKFLANNRPGEGTMTESKLYGTSKISYQNVDNARIVIKHTEHVNHELAAGRTQNIGRIYIESADGERFMYPFKHLGGARAMARHVAEGGKPFDDFGKHIVGLSEEMSKLRKFKNYMGRSAVMAESLGEYMDAVYERIATVKKTIEGLQRPNYYKETFEAFEAPVFEDVPDDVAENWIDQLTIRQFNEELKDVFPYIYKLVSEVTKAKTLGPADLLGEAKCDDCGKDPCECESVGEASYNTTPEDIELEQGFTRMMGQFAEGAMDELAAELGQIADNEDYDKLYALLSDNGPVGKYLQDMITDITSETGLHPDDDIEEIMNRMMDQIASDFGEGSSQPRDETNAKGPMTQADEPKEQKTPLGEFILAHYDRQSGQFPKGETAVLTMVEKDYGEQFIEPAKAFIEKVNQTFEQFQMRTQPQQMETGHEFDRMRELAGLR